MTQAQVNSEHVKVFTVAVAVFEWAIYGKFMGEHVKSLMTAKRSNCRMISIFATRPTADVNIHDVQS